MLAVMKKRIMLVLNDIRQTAAEDIAEIHQSEVQSSAFPVCPSLTIHRFQNLRDEC